MINGTEAITTAVLGKALDVTSWRHHTIAANIANARTQGYVPQRVSFSSHWEQAQGTLRNGGTLDATMLAGLQVQLMPVLDAAGQPMEVRLDAEVANLASNNLQYQALIKGLSRHLSVLMFAASDGKK
jgi:flagellar basal-body rod protein FlgB